MKNKKILTFFIAGMFLLLSFTAASAIKINSCEKMQDEGSIYVFVYEENDEPGHSMEGVEGIEVEIENLDETFSMTLITNDRGICFFEDIPLGAYTVYINGGSLYKNCTSKALLDKENPHAEVRILLESKARIFNRINMILSILSCFKILIKNHLLF